MVTTIYSPNVVCEGHNSHKITESSGNVRASTTTNSLDIHACVCDTDQVYKNGLRANSAELSQEFGLCGQFASRNRIKECMNQSKES